MYTESLRAFLKPVLAYLDDESVSEILINGPEDVWIERKGRLYKTEARFSEEGLLGAARNMAQFVGRTITDERPRLDARLPDGSRIHVVLPPVARCGTTIAIRKFFRDKLRLEHLVKLGSATESMGRVLDAIVRTKQNVIVAGGTGSGKTTLLNIVSSLIPASERILTIEDSAELQLNQEHIVSFEARPADRLGKGEVNMGDLLHSSLRLRPDRIIVGEVRGAECFHLMQAMNTGHGGSMSTIHANTPTDTLRRLESLCLMSEVELPLVAVRAQVASAIKVVICCDRLYDGSRKVISISEVLPLNEKGDYRTQDIWVYTPLGKDDDGNVFGYHAPTGIIPHFAQKARAYGFPDLDDRFFDPATYGVPPPPLFLLGQDAVVHWAPSLKHRESGQPDPATMADELRRFEAQLRAEHEENRRQGDREETHATQLEIPVSTQRPRPLATRAQRTSSGLTRNPLPPPVDEDKTPPPTRNPLLGPGPGARPGARSERSRERPGDSLASSEETPSGRTQAMPPLEPSVQVAPDLLRQAREEGLEDDDEATGGVEDSRFAKTVATPRSGTPRVGVPSERARQSQSDSNESRQRDDKTHIKPVPDKFRR